ncbi:hypothetical protein SCHPADRAFT_463611 [Schizopora paradoxa]|uniref:Uncharacterized protein n=1 Tax=Schizopora paradoxa TaxID=27342 RepID=A0A0H2S3S9_9AGAM|nr:hypothetical protein SCHPADRAFT_463611 [Schizopora paradoxa]
MFTAEPVDADLGRGDEQVNLANALDLSESEDEEEMENIFGDFAQPDGDMDLDGVRQEKLYFFQFPEPFPNFAVPVAPDKGKGVAKGEHAEDNNPKTEDIKSEKGKKVSFAPDVKAPSGASTPSTIEPDKDPLKDAPPPLPQGIIGRLEIYQSGAVKMRLENGNLLDVTAATQPSFLQHAVHVDVQNKKLCVLGEVNRRFVVSPNLDALIEQLEMADRGEQGLDISEGLITMDTS